MNYDVTKYFSYANMKFKFYVIIHIEYVIIHIEKKDNVIDQNLYSSLLPTSPVPGRLYFLPKVHKQGNPGRPIILGNSTATEKLSAFVDFHLTRYMSCNYIPSYIKDTTDFLNAICKIPKLSNDTLLVTMDVKALYTNIPHKEGIAAVQTIQY